MDDDPIEVVEEIGNGLRWPLTEAMSLARAPQHFCQSLGSILDAYSVLAAGIRNPELRDDTYDLEKALSCEYVVASHLREQIANGDLLADGFKTDGTRSRRDKDWWNQAKIDLAENTAAGPGSTLFGVRVWRKGMFVLANKGIPISISNAASVLSLFMPHSKKSSSGPQVATALGSSAEGQAVSPIGPVALGGGSPSRRAANSLEDYDRPLIAEMEQMRLARTASGREDAAWQVIEREAAIGTLQGKGNQESARKRLMGRYTKVYGEQEWPGRKTR